MGEGPELGGRAGEALAPLAGSHSSVLRISGAAYGETPL